MRIGLLLAIALLSGVYAYAREGAVRFVELPEGLYEEYENGSFWWEGASADAVASYHTSTVSTWFCSLTSLFPVFMIFSAVSQYSPHSVPMARLLFAGLTLTDFAFLCSDGVALIQSSRRVQPVIYTLPFQDRSRAPLLIQVIAGHLPFNVQYRIHSLWQPGISDSDYGDDEYLALAKVLSSKGQYLRLSVDQDEETGSAISWFTERVLQMEVRQVGGNTSALVHFEETSARKWIEPYLLDLSEIESSDELYQAAISPEWMINLSQWLSEHSDEAFEEEVIHVEVGPFSAKVFDDPFDRYSLDQGEEHCWSLDMGSVQWNLPKEGIVFSDTGCFSLGQKGVKASQGGSHIAQNDRDSRYYLYKDKAVKQLMVTAFNGVMGKTLKYGMSRFLGKNHPQPVLNRGFLGKSHPQPTLKRNLDVYHRGVNQQIAKSQTSQLSYVDTFVDQPIPVMWLPNREGTARGRAREKSGVNSEGASKRKSSKDMLSVKPTLKSLQGKENPESFIKGVENRKLGVLIEESEDVEERITETVTPSDDESVLRVNGEWVKLDDPAPTFQRDLAQPYLPGEPAFEVLIEEVLTPLDKDPLNPLDRKLGHEQIKQYVEGLFEEIREFEWFSSDGQHATKADVPGLARAVLKKMFWPNRDRRQGYEGGVPSPVYDDSDNESGMWDMGSTYLLSQESLAEVAQHYYPGTEGFEQLHQVLLARMADQQHDISGVLSLSDDLKQQYRQGLEAGIAEEAQEFGGLQLSVPFSLISDKVVARAWKSMVDLLNPEMRPLIMEIALVTEESSWKGLEWSEEYSLREVLYKTKDYASGTDFFEGILNEVIASLEKDGYKLQNKVPSEKLKDDYMDMLKEWIRDYEIMGNPHVGPATPGDIPELAFKILTILLKQNAE
ncbi:MAG: hypothetical protein ACR2PX_00445 [Endozoicomonas sp.]|uniref:hypothetical protein n=1 Tax=Endozoicomonas sp. TaxID=1892382 RepID=UPI003D9ADBB0